jgi:hypothetical protein
MRQCLCVRQLWTCWASTLHTGLWPQQEIIFVWTIEGAYLLNDSIETGCHCHSYFSLCSPDLAAAYFDVIAHATEDVGVSVRKRAVKVRAELIEEVRLVSTSSCIFPGPRVCSDVQVLWDICVHCPGFDRCTEAVAHIMARAADTEETVRRLATALCGGLWFGADAGRSMSHLYCRGHLVALLLCNLPACALVVGPC